MPYAINISDMTNFSPDVIFQVMLAPVVPLRAHVKAEPGKVDGAALLLECNDERAAAIVFFVRKKWSAKQIRIYYRPGPTGRWKKQP